MPHDFRDGRRSTHDFKAMIDSNFNKFFNVKDEYQNLPLEKIQEISKSKTLPFAVAAINIEGDLNTGTIIRTACLMGAERVFIIGRTRYDKRSTVGAQNYVEIIKLDALGDDLSICKPIFDLNMANYGYSPVFIETGGINIEHMDWATIPGKVCLVFGSEANGIPGDLIGDAQIVTIPQAGIMRSYNVGVACGIATWEYTKALRNLHGKTWIRRTPI